MPPSLTGVNPLFPKRLAWKLLPPYLIAVGLILVGISFFAARDMTAFYHREKAGDMESLARVIAADLSPLLRESPTLETLSWCGEMARRSRTRVTVVGRDGTILCDSEEDPEKMDNHSTRPEVQGAWKNGSGMAIRYSYTLEKPMMYVAVPSGEGNKIPVVRIAVPVSRMTEALWSTKMRFAGGVIIAGLFIVFTTLFLSSRITSSIKEIRQGAQRFARGDFSSKLRIPETEEFGVLAEELNRMAQQLDDRIRTVIDQRNELEAVLGSMVEGVLAFDPEERIININQAASALLSLDPEKSRNKTIQEALRNSELQEFVKRTLGSKEPLEAEITFYNGGKKFLQVHGTPLRDSSGGEIGALVVLNDVTKIRRLEDIRREFVANASHEIRTPVTSIKGFVETLLEGALEDRETTERFLGIIGKHADRLSAIVQDLLSLSKIETQAEKGEIFLEEGKVLDIVKEAVKARQMEAEEKRISIAIRCPEDLLGRFNPSLLVQALINLIDNAVKYSGEGSAVIVDCGLEKDALRIMVSDSGAGIEKKDLPRIFERFYTVDKARSRKLGGTGLGLAIVKHIVQAHGGEVRVTSSPGKGSSFAVILPM